MPRFLPLLPLLCLAAMPASADPVTYCGGGLMAQTVYNQITARRGSSIVSYFAQFQNSDPRQRRLQASLAPIQQVKDMPVHEMGEPFALGAREVRAIPLFSLSVPNAFGAGAPPPAEVARLLRISCSYP